MRYESVHILQLSSLQLHLSRHLVPQVLISVLVGVSDLEYGFTQQLYIVYGHTCLCPLNFKEMITNRVEISFNLSELSLNICSFKLNVFFEFLHVLIQLIESTCCCLLMSFKTGGKLLITISKIFNVSPTTKRFSSSNAILNFNSIWKIRIIQISVISEQEWWEIQS